MTSSAQPTTPEVLRYTAFADTADGGNPAGVVLDARGLDDAAMLAVARAVGFSETAFVTGEPVASGPVTTVPVRFFTPDAEIPFCGHASVALATALAERDGAGTYEFATQAGPFRIATSPGEEGMCAAFTGPAPQTRPIPADRLARLLDLLGLEPGDLAAGFPPLEAFAGNWHPVLVLAEAGLFHQFRFSPPAVAALMREAGWVATVTVLLRRGEREYEARNLFPVGRITEDPATGSAAASTGAYLAALGLAAPGEAITIHQGAHVGRPSLLVVTVTESGRPEVSGSARPLA